LVVCFGFEFELHARKSFEFGVMGFQPIRNDV
jgi:hypothetical protein